MFCKYIAKRREDLHCIVGGGALPLLSFFFSGYFISRPLHLMQLCCVEIVAYSLPLRLAPPSSSALGIPRSHACGHTRSLFCSLVFQG